MRIKRMLHDVFGVLMAMGTLAALAVDEGDAERAAMLLGATEANWRRYGSVPRLVVDDRERCVKECQKVLGEEVYRRTFDAGARMTLDEAIKFAVNNEPPRPTGRHARL